MRGQQQSLLLKPLSPFRLDLTTWVLRRRRHNIIDHFENGIYKRILIIDSKRTGIEIQQSGSIEKPLLRVKLSGTALNAIQKKLLKNKIQELLGTQINFQEFYEFSKRDDNLGPIVHKYYGFKPPRFTGVFEAAVNGICCQQLSLAVGIHLLNRITRACSEPINNDGEIMYGFPQPAEMAKLKTSQLLKMGFSQNKAKALIELAKKATDCNLDSIGGMDDEAAIKELGKLRGLGRWTAEYILLRGLGRIHIYPGDDSGFRNGLERWLKLEGKMDYKIVRDVMSNWRPYCGMVYFHMLLEKLSREGLIA